MTNQLLSLLQLCDSNFPSGAFSHSFGLETYIYEGAVHNTETFANALTMYVNTQITYTDGLACRLAYDYIQADKLEKLWELDCLLSALALAKETREGNRRIGERMIKLCRELYDCPLLIQYDQLVKQKQLFGHSALVFALVGTHLKIDRTQAVTAYMYSVVQSLIQNAVRAIPLGQTDGQKLLLGVHSLLHERMERIECATEDEIGMNTPGLEIAQMRHEGLPVRLFMS